MKWCILLVVVILLGNTGPTCARGRMFRSLNTTKGQFPSLARLWSFFPDNSGTCSGTLIRSKWILTAAHCVIQRIEEINIPVKFVAVYLGQMKFNETAFYAIAYQTDIIAHNDFELTNYGGAINDIALIKIPPVEFNSIINMARISRYEININKRVKVAGWGALTPDGPSSEYPQWNYFTVMDNGYCMERSNNEWQLLESQICLYNPKATSCGGDSGGGAYDGKTVFGVGSSISNDGCSVEFPMVYTNVSYFNDWIEDNISQYEDYDD